MPANKKYLSTPGQRILKITAAILGGYLVTTAFHLCLMALFDQKTIITTMTFSSYLVWAMLMIVAFLSKNGWKIWGWYILATILLFSPYLYKTAL